MSIQPSTLNNFFTTATIGVLSLKCVFKNTLKDYLRVSKTGLFTPKDCVHHSSHFPSLWQSGHARSSFSVYIQCWRKHRNRKKFWNGEARTSLQKELEVSIVQLPVCLYVCFDTRKCESVQCQRIKPLFEKRCTLGSLFFYKMAVHPD